MKKETKELMELLSLEGKISQKHAEEIEEILEAFLERANKAGYERGIKQDDYTALNERYHICNTKQPI